MTKQEETTQQAILTTAHFDYQRGLNKYAYFKVHDKATSEDLVQDTFMKTWAYFVRGGKIDMMKSFLYHVLNNLIIDEYRKHKTVSLDVLLDAGYEPGVVVQETLLNILDGKKAADLIFKLPKKYQDIMRMKYMRDLSLTEISLITGQSRNTVAVQTHRGLNRLKDLYKSMSSTVV